MFSTTNPLTYKGRRKFPFDRSKLQMFDVTMFKLRETMTAAVAIGNQMDQRSCVRSARLFSLVSMFTKESGGSAAAGRHASPTRC